MSFPSQNSRVFNSVPCGDKAHMCLCCQVQSNLTVRPQRFFFSKFCLSAAISSFTILLSPNWLYFNTILACLPLFLNGLPCCREQREQPPPCIPCSSPGDHSLPKLLADWDVWHPEEGEKQLALAVPMPLFASSFKAGWLSSLAASTQSISCCMAGFRCKELGTISSGCHSEFCYCAGIERHLCAFTLKLWLTWGRLNFWKTLFFFFSLFYRLQHSELNF